MDANPLVAPTGGTTTLSAVVSGGVGPFEYEWRGYRDDGTPFNFTFSNRCAAQPSVGLVFPGSDFYFFVEVRDCGDVPQDAPPPEVGGCNLCRGRRANKAWVRVHESDGPIARFSISAAEIHANATPVTFDATASTAVSTPIQWTLQYIGDVAEPADIEGYVTLEANSGGMLFWDTTFSTPSDLLTLDLDGAKFPSPGAYRMLLQVNGGFSSHQTYEYFFVKP